MNNTFKTKYAEIQKGRENFINECLKTICDCVRTQKPSVLVIGNTKIFAIGNKPYVSTNNEPLIEMYSEDGWSSVDDIANWADICIDAVECYKAGNKGYSVMWNVPKKVAE